MLVLDVHVLVLVVTAPPNADDSMDEAAPSLQGWTRNSTGGANGTMCVARCAVVSTLPVVPSIAAATRADGPVVPMARSVNYKSNAWWL